ncbi:MAG: site-specific DNA-methyltransferase [Oscillospiraceae bacterium]|nr:site-specific DNA-methyltransferase [Oscillospiraceae bacterium]
MISDYFTSNDIEPRFICGNSLEVLKEFPDNCIDMAMTSPPYWGKREYVIAESIGLEKDYNEYIEKMLSIFEQVQRVLKINGSFWLNIGDSYLNKNLLGLPWRVAIRMCDEQGWILRNSVVWNKVKGAPDNSLDKLRNVHEMLFHFVKSKKYYYDVSAARKEPLKAKVQNGAVVSATGVTGVRYKRQIELSTVLTDEQKQSAFFELTAVLDSVRNGEIEDFRMIIKGQQRTTHSNSTKVSGRAKELETKGFYFLKYHPDGAKLGDVWDIIPEDTQGRKLHFAPYPADLCRTPILTTCPANGVVLDPFSGTGTTMAVAYESGRKSVGIEIAQEYIDYAEERIGINEQNQGFLWSVYQAK